jgi:AcrR family transcriptional regulator
MGLRETKKERTREQLLAAALALIARQGFEQTTINEIADEVQVSSRTFLRYFPTKEDVVVAWVDDEFGVLVENVAVWPGGTTAFSAMAGAMRAALISYEARHDFFLMIEMVIAGSATMRARKVERASILVTELSAVLAQRMGLCAESGLLPDLIAGAVVAASRSAIRAWLAANGNTSLVDLYDRAIGSLEFKALDQLGPVDNALQQKIGFN